jgi:polyhydroxyalkanoate synthesis regulator phasin
MYIHLDNDGKIDDICSRLDGGHKRSEDFLDEDYIIIKNEKNLRIGDTWDFENECSLKDSPQRFIVPEKSELELLKEDIEILKDQIKQLESK